MAAKTACAPCISAARPRGRAAPLTRRYRAAVVTAATDNAAAQTVPSGLVKEGDRIPDGIELKYFDREGNLQTVTTTELFAGRRVVLFAVPGAFTPTCSLKHIPGFVDSAAEMQERGVDDIACVSVNDAFVMQAWGKAVDPSGRVLMLADGSARLARALGVQLDLSEPGLGVRSRRYAMLVDDGKVTALRLEKGGAFTISGADDIMAAL